jgi:glucose uptake protein GlcU
MEAMEGHSGLTLFETLIGGIIVTIFIVIGVIIHHWSNKDDHMTDEEYRYKQNTNKFNK